MFGISLKGDSLTLQGIERLGFAEGEHWDWQVFDGSPATLNVGQSETAQRICDAMNAGAPESLPVAPESPWLRPQNGWTAEWSRDLGLTEIRAVAVHGELLLVGTEEGDVVQLGSGTVRRCGRTNWARTGWPAPCSWLISTPMGWSKRWWARMMVYWPHSKATAASSAGAGP